MSERDLIVRDVALREGDSGEARARDGGTREAGVVDAEPIEWEGSTTTALASNEPSRGGVVGWVGARIEAAIARVVDGFARGGPGTGADADAEQSVALARTGG